MSTSNNELERLANSETNKMVEAILKGVPVNSVKNPTETKKSEQDILNMVSKTYKNEVLGDKQN